MCKASLHLNNKSVWSFYFLKLWEARIWVLSPSSKQFCGDCLSDPPPATGSFHLSPWVLSDPFQLFLVSFAAAPCKWAAGRLLTPVRVKCPWNVSGVPAYPNAHLSPNSGKYQVAHGTRMFQGQSLSRARLSITGCVLLDEFWLTWHRSSEKRWCGCLGRGVSQCGIQVVADVLTPGSCFLLWACSVRSSALSLATSIIAPSLSFCSLEYGLALNFKQGNSRQ